MRELEVQLSNHMKEQREQIDIKNRKWKNYPENDQLGPEILKQSGLPQLVLQEELSHQPTKQQNKMKNLIRNCKVILRKSINKHHNQDWPDSRVGSLQLTCHHMNFACLLIL